MRYEDVSPTMRSFIGCREAFRRLGFTADDLYMEVASALEIGGRLGCYVTLRTQGKSFSMFCGAVDGDGSALRAELQAVAQAMAEGTFEKGAGERMLHECEAWSRSAELVMAIWDKGIRTPAGSEEAN